MPAAETGSTGETGSNIKNDNIAKYEAFVRGHKKGHIMQSTLWAEVKPDWKNEIITVNGEDGAIRGAMSLLIRKVPFTGHTIMYSPRGPVCDIHDEETQRALLAQVKELARKHRSFVLRMDPDVKIDDERFAQIARNIGFEIKNSGKNFEGIQPRFVFRLDISGKTEDEVMKLFHQKTRYNIRVAVKKGVEVKIGSREDLPEFHNIMVTTGVRDGFVTRSLSYFQLMYDKLSKTDNLRLYIATHNGKMIAGTICALYGDKCWYLYGASANEHRDLMPNYLLQWEMIRWAVEQRCNIYDFRGVSGDIDESNPLYGLYRFKKGFNGELTEFVGQLEYVFNPTVNMAVDKGEKVFKTIRRKLYLMKNKDKSPSKHDDTAANKPVNPDGSSGSDGSAGLDGSNGTNGETNG